MFFQKSEVKRVMNRMKRWKYFKSKKFNLFVGTPKISSMDELNVLLKKSMKMEI